MMERVIRNTKSDTVIWVGAFILANFRGTVFWEVGRQAFKPVDLAWVEVFVWGLLVVLAGRSLIRRELLVDYSMAWKENAALILFIAVALLSTFWSISFSASVYRGSVLLCSTLLAAYIGLCFSIRGVLNVMFRFGTLLLIICFAFAVFLPAIGVMSWEPYTGSWRGIYWHKNHYGGIVALFSTVFFLGAFNALGKEKNTAVLNFVFYLFSVVLIYFSRSAAGYMLLILMSASVLLGYVWLKMRRYLKPAHYYTIVGLTILVVVIIMLNLNFVLASFGRDATLTGRSSLWAYLIEEVVARSPWVGYGFGAIWSFDSFRIATQDILGWGYPVVIADNGFLDILLHVGFVGFIPFIWFLLSSLVRFFWLALRMGNIAMFSPLFILLFAFLANISFSFFLEAEAFVWMALVAMSFAAIKERQTISSSTSSATRTTYSVPQ
jgi:O-antigen ligase